MPGFALADNNQAHGRDSALGEPGRRWTAHRGDRPGTESNGAVAAFLVNQLTILLSVATFKAIAPANRYRLAGLATSAVLPGAGLIVASRFQRILKRRAQRRLSCSRVCQPDSRSICCSLGIKYGVAQWRTCSAKHPRQSRGIEALSSSFLLYRPLPAYCGRSLPARKHACTRRLSIAGVPESRIERACQHSFYR